jgi:uncharacterized protein YbaA (DUF1428 family)
MARYVDYFIIPLSKKHLKIYQRMAKASAKAFMKAGALEYVETIADDVPKGKITSFPRSVKLKAGETIILGHATYKSRAHRDSVMKKVHEDPVIRKFWDDMPFDGMRMIWGGFTKFVALTK